MSTSYYAKEWGFYSNIDRNSVFGGEWNWKVRERRIHEMNYDCWSQTINFKPSSLVQKPFIKSYEVEKRFDQKPGVEPMHNPIQLRWRASCWGFPDQQKFSHTHFSVDFDYSKTSRNRRPRWTPKWSVAGSFRTGEVGIKMVQKSSEMLLFTKLRYGLNRSRMWGEFGSLLDDCPQFPAWEGGRSRLLQRVTFQNLF